LEAAFFVFSASTCTSLIISVLVLELATCSNVTLAAFPKIEAYSIGWFKRLVLVRVRDCMSVVRVRALRLRQHVYLLEISARKGCALKHAGDRPHLDAMQQRENGPRSSSSSSSSSAYSSCALLRVHALARPQTLVRAAALISELTFVHRLDQEVEEVARDGQDMRWRVPGRVLDILQKLQKPLLVPVRHFFAGFVAR
jgi:hypothetical protein